MQVRFMAIRFIHCGATVFLVFISLQFSLWNTDFGLYFCGITFICTSISLIVWAKLVVVLWRKANIIRFDYKCSTIYLNRCVFFSVLHPFQLVTSFNVETTTKTEFHFQEHHAQYLYSYTNSSDILKPSVEFLFCQNFLFVFSYLHRLWERIKIFVEQKYSAK